MRCLNARLTLTLLCLCAAKLVVAQQQEPVAITRLYTGVDGLSHFEQVNVKLSPVAGAPTSVEESEHLSMKNAYVVRIAPGFFEDWHNADVRRYVVTIRGRAEVEVAGGQKLVAQPGQVVLAEDLTGKGHRFRVLGDSNWVALFVDMEK